MSYNLAGKLQSIVNQLKAYLIRHKARNLLLTSFNLAHSGTVIIKIYDWSVVFIVSCVFMYSCDPYEQYTLHSGKCKSK
jgi:hypothetical protein